MPSPGLLARVARARYSIERLRRIAETPYETYISNRDLMDVAERNMEILLEAILDLASYIASRKGLSGITGYRALMESMVNHGILPVKYLKYARAIPGLRNILVHYYAEIRHDTLYRIIKEELDVLSDILYILFREVEKLDP